MTTREKVWSTGYDAALSGRYAGGLDPSGAPTDATAKLAAFDREFGAGAKAETDGEPEQCPHLMDDDCPGPLCPVGFRAGVCHRRACACDDCPSFSACAAHEPQPGDYWPAPGQPCPRKPVPATVAAGDPAALSNALREIIELPDLDDRRFAATAALRLHGDGKIPIGWPEVPVAAGGSTSPAEG